MSSPAPALPAHLTAMPRLLKLAAMRELAPELLLTAKTRRWPRRGAPDLVPFVPHAISQNPDHFGGMNDMPPQIAQFVAGHDIKVTHGMQDCLPDEAINSPRALIASRATAPIEEYRTPT
jgi:hypothetical protein